MNLGILKLGLRVTASCRLKKMLEVSTLSFNAGRCMSQKQSPDSLENSRCRANHFESILCQLLKVLDVTDFCSTNSRLQMSPEIKIIRVVNQGEEQAMLLVHLVLCVVPETGCSRIPEVREESMAQQHHAWTVKGFRSADPHSATALEGRSVGNRGKKPPA